MTNDKIAKLAELLGEYQAEILAVQNDVSSMTPEACKALAACYTILEGLSVEKPKTDPVEAFMYDLKETIMKQSSPVGYCDYLMREDGFSEDEIQRGMDILYEWIHEKNN